MLQNPSSGIDPNAKRFHAIRCSKSSNQFEISTCIQYFDTISIENLKHFRSQCPQQAASRIGVDFVGLALNTRKEALMLNFHLEHTEFYAGSTVKYVLAHAEISKTQFEDSEA